MANVPRDAALEYAKRGWRVFPIVPRSKIPAPKNWPNAATTDPERIRRWWSGPHRDHGVGIATGKGSGIFVLDVDPGKGGDESLAELEEKYGALPDTVECLTGGHGQHLYFQWSDDFEIRNTTDLGGYAGLDIRGKGGYVVAPPSVHENRRAYEWEASSRPGDVKVVAASPWLLELIGRPGPNGDGAPKIHILQATPRIPVGSRNDTLIRLAGGLRHDGYSPEEIEGALQIVRLRRCDELDDPRHPFPEEEVWRIAQSAGRWEPEHEIEFAAPQGWLTDASVRSLGEIMEGDKPERPPSIIGEGLVPERSVVGVFSPPNLGKTQLAIKMSLSVAGGWDFFGWPTTACNVLYLCPELELPEFWERVEAIERADCEKRGENPDAPVVRQRLERARKRVFPVTGDMLPRLPNLADPDDRREIIRAAQARQAKLTLLDPLALFHTVNENSNEEMLGIMRGLHEIKTAADTTPLVVHHSRKGKPGQEDPGFDAMRGAGAVAAHARVIFRLDEKWGRIRLSCPKATHSRRPDPIWLERLDSGALVRTVAPENPSVGRDQRAAAVVAYVVAQGGREVTAEEISQRVAAVANVEERTIRNYLNDEAADHEPRIEALGSTKDRRWRFLK